MSTITLTFPGTFAIPVTWATGTIDFIEEPQVFEEEGLLVPPVFGTAISSPEPQSVSQGIVIPPVFGTASAFTQDPSIDPPPVEPPSTPGQSTVTPPEYDPDGSGAVLGASGVAHARGVRVVGG